MIVSSWNDQIAEIDSLFTPRFSTKHWHVQFSKFSTTIQSDIIYADDNLIVDVFGTEFEILCLVQCRKLKLSSQVN